MINKYKEYTNRELEKIAEMKRSGKTLKFIASHLGRTRYGLETTYRRKVRGNY